MVYLVSKPGSQHWGLCSHRKLENHVNVGTVSIWDAKERMRMSPLAAKGRLGENFLKKID